MKKVLLAVTVAGAMAASSAGFAAMTGLNPYVAAGYGFAQMKYRTTDGTTGQVYDVSPPKNIAAPYIGLGFYISPSVAIEMDYHAQASKSNSVYHSKIKSFNIDGIYGYQFAKDWKVLGAVGISFSSEAGSYYNVGDGNGNIPTASDDSMGIRFGAGVSYQFAKDWAARAEVKYHKFSSRLVKSGMYETIGATYSF